MTNFNFNLLATAQTAIGKQNYQIVKWLSKTTNEIGFDVDVYDSPIDSTGSVQPVQRNKYSHLGLDFKKTYIQIWDVDQIDTLTRLSNADRVIYNGGSYKALPGTDWHNQGGWGSVMCVRVGDA